MSRVLWVADGSGDALSELDQLVLEGFQVDMVDGPNALMLCASTPYDVALVDSRMPGADGLATLRLLRSASPTLRAILIAGTGCTEMVREAMREGVEAVFHRPAEAACFLPLLLA